MVTSPLHQLSGFGAGARLYLCASVSGDVEAVARMLEFGMGFRRLDLACEPDRCDAHRARDAVRAAIPVPGGSTRAVVTGVCCDAVADVLESAGFTGVVVASTRAAMVGRRPAAGARLGRWPAHAWQTLRRPLPPVCGHGAPNAAYVLDIGRDPRLAAEHLATLVAVLETVSSPPQSGEDRMRLGVSPFPQGPSVSGA